MGMSQPQSHDQKTQRAEHMLALDVEHKMDDNAGSSDKAEHVHRRLDKKTGASDEHYRRRQLHPQEQRRYIRNENTRHSARSRQGDFPFRPSERIAAVHQSERKRSERKRPAESFIRGGYDEWTCTACRARNHPSVRKRCDRCGATRRKASRWGPEVAHGRPRRSDERRSSSSSSKWRRSKRKREPIGPSSTAPSTQKTGSLEWPPMFENYGSMYIFDNRSSMFYTAPSDFFYDPKSCLYYGNKQKAYYKYCADKMPPFEEVASTSGGGDGGSQTVELVAVNGQSRQSPVSDAKEPVTPAATCPKPPDEPLKKIIVNLKTKEFKKKKSPKCSVTKKEAAKAATHGQRIHVANVEKWNTMTAAKKTLECTKAAAKKAQKSAMTSLPPQSSSTAVSKTSKGEPICLMCMRKFRTEQQLQLHETKSQLHQDNVKKHALKKQTEESSGKFPRLPKWEERRSTFERQESAVKSAAHSFLLPPPRPAWLQPTFRVLGRARGASQALDAKEPRGSPKNDETNRNGS